MDECRRGFSRRDFLRGTSAAAAAIVISPLFRPRDIFGQPHSSVTAAVDPSLKVNPLTKQPGQLPLLQKNDPPLPAATAVPRSSLKITSLEAWESGGLVRVSGVLTHSALTAAATAQNCAWFLHAWDRGMWREATVPPQRSPVSVSPNQQVKVEGYYQLGRDRAHYSQRGGKDWGWSLSGLDLYERPTKFRLRVSTLQPGMIRVDPKLASKQEEVRECWFGKFVVQYRCPNWEKSEWLEFSTADEAFNIGWPALKQLGFEHGGILKNGSKYVITYRCVSWKERNYQTRKEVDKLHTHLSKLAGVEARIVQR